MIASRAPPSSSTIRGSTQRGNGRFGPLVAPTLGCRRWHLPRPDPRGPARQRARAEAVDAGSGRRGGPQQARDRGGPAHRHGVRQPRHRGPARSHRQDSRDAQGARWRRSAPATAPAWSATLSTRVGSGTGEGAPSSRGAPSDSPPNPAVTTRSSASMAVLRSRSSTSSALRTPGSSRSRTIGASFWRSPAWSSCRSSSDRRMPPNPRRSGPRIVRPGPAEVPLRPPRSKASRSPIAEGREPGPAGSFRPT